MGTLQSAVAQEAALLSRFIALLQEEQAVLQEGQADRLPAIAKQKTMLYEELNAAALQRNTLLKAAGLNIDKAGMDAWFAAHSTEKALQLAWRQLLKAAEEARQLNEQNGLIIKLRLQATGDALSVLHHQAQGRTLYGRDGQSSAISGYRLIDSA